MPRKQKSYHRRSVRRVPARPVDPGQSGVQAKEAGATVASAAKETSPVKVKAASPTGPLKKPTASLDLSYVSSDLKRIAILAVATIALIVILSLLLR